MQRAAWTAIRIRICRLSALAAVVPMYIGISAVRAERPIGVDVAEFQGTIDWGQVYANGAGRQFAFIRAMHGSLSDGRFTTNMSGARNAGVLASPYFYATPVYDPDYGLPGEDPTTQANRFVSSAHDYLTAGYLPPAIDVELGGGQVPVGAASLADWVNAWINSVQQQTGVEAMIYTNSQYFGYLCDSRLTQRKLWVADWVATISGWEGSWTETKVKTPGYNPPHGTGCWSAWTFWQYSDAGNVTGLPSVPGIPARVDLDVFNGTLTELQALRLGTSGAIIARSPDALTPTVKVGQNAASQTFEVWNSGTNTLKYMIVDNVTWLSVSPASGTSTGEHDAITVTYSTASLPIDTYAATINIFDQGASNSPQTVSVTLNICIVGDFDCNGHINSADVTSFIGCMTGQGNPQTDPDCRDGDLDNDGDVDQVDFGLLQRCITPPGVPVDPNCAI